MSKNSDELQRAMDKATTLLNAEISGVAYFLMATTDDIRDLHSCGNIPEEQAALILDHMAARLREVAPDNRKAN